MCDGWIIFVGLSKETVLNVERSIDCKLDVEISDVVWIFMDIMEEFRDMCETSGDSKGSTGK